MFVNVNRIMKNYLLLYKVTPQVSKILFLVYLTNYSLECAGAEVKHLKRGEDGEMLRGWGCRWLMTIMGTVVSAERGILMGFAYIKGF